MNTQIKLTPTQKRLLNYLKAEFNGQNFSVNQISREFKRSNSTILRQFRQLRQMKIIDFSYGEWDEIAIKFLEQE